MFFKSPQFRVTAMFMLFLLTMSVSALAQPEAPAWEAYVFIHNIPLDGESLIGHVERITPTGGEAITPQTNFGTASTSFTAQARLSPDARYLIVSGQFAGSPGQSMVAYDLVNGVCCLPVEVPAAGGEAISLGGFDPDSRYLSYSYFGGYGEGGGLGNGGIAVADIVNVFTPEDDAVIARDLPMSSVLASVPELYEGVWAFMGDWKADGIRFTSNCYGCEGVFEAEYALWDPFTDTFSANSGDSFSIFGEQFDPTGEMIWIAQDASYPYSTEGAYFPIPNVVEYSPSGTLYGADTLTIFNDPALVDVGRANWGMGGQVVVIRPGSGGYWLVHERDGTVSPIMGVSESFVIGTPTGWLMVNDGATEKILYSVEGETREITQVSTFPPDRYVEVLWVSQISEAEAFDLPPFSGIGTPSSLDSFLAEPTRAAVTPVVGDLTIGGSGTQCPEFLESRLVVGQRGRVTPGAPNRVRSAPSLDDSRVIGEIPGEGVFAVLEGPICDPGGIAWWRVRYNDIEGWTAEGQGDTYFTEPIR
ncbi:MAG: SH3 domain-containing protein [Aggregatilineales bacterium]